MVTNAESSPTKVAFLVVLGVLLAVCGFVWWRYGSQGMGAFLMKLMMWLLIIGAIAAIIILVVWLFQTKRIDMVQLHKDRIIESCELNQTPYAQKLVFRAHGDDWATREVGTVIGACMIYAEPPSKEELNEDGDYIRTPMQEKFRRMIFVAFKPKGFLNSILGSKEVVAGIPEDFGPLSGEIIWLNGMTFSPSLFRIYFMSHHWENRAYIDETIRGNIYRYTLQENLKEMATLMEDAIDVSPRHKKQTEISNVQTLPTPGAAPPQR